jgi:hypothetical protein
MRQRECEEIKEESLSFKMNGSLIPFLKSIHTNVD